ncbi:hypothetical protein Taro_009344 [Colocasia esculenta]|uniref:NAD(P)-binding domain-containing protein n=1 Tax=Colocasia esculenta TaxID=4460 RepID=A0A843U652_COLES|nr:hypothetical protein [Colocasia esculenta]
MASAAAAAAVVISTGSALRPRFNLLRRSSCRLRPFVSTRNPLGISSLPHPLTPVVSTISLAAAAASKMEASSEITEQVETAPAEESRRYKKIFVAGATGRTGKRIVELLVAKGFEVRAGAVDLDKARGSLPSNANVQIVRADVTEGPEKLVEAIGDADAVICATGFRYSWDVFAPWKVSRMMTLHSPTRIDWSDERSGVVAMKCP